MMRLTVLCLAAAFTLACMDAAPAPAQTLDPGFANTPLTPMQEQIVSEIRNRDRELFLRAARSAGITALLPGGRVFIKPLADWTQADIAAFRRRYDTLLSVRGADAEAYNWSVIETATFFWQLTQDRGDGGDGNGEGGEGAD